MSTPIETLHSLGQSLWYDNIERRMLVNGGLKRLITAGEIRGVTSNPSIFKKAIADSSDYDSALQELKRESLPVADIFDRLAIEDIRDAADLFLPLYESTGGGDGYVSIEVNPHLSDDTEATAEEAKRLWAAVDRPNLMVKIPATEAGIPAIRQSIASGLNINITLIFSIERYLEVIDAYFSGLEERVEAGEEIEGIASVASFFVSRVDTKVDRWLEEVVRREGPSAAIAHGLGGRIAIANAKIAYRHFRRTHGDDRFQELASRGARLQRPLWASTSTKNPAYPDTMYVEELIGPDTVNTVPPETLDAYRDHGKPEARIERDLERVERELDALASIGLSIERATRELEEEGVKAFTDAYDSLLKAIENRIR